MKKYYCFFLNRLQVGFQYRASAFGGLLTHFLWGVMNCIAYKTIIESNPSASPMDIEAVVSYIWLNQAFLILFNTWAADGDIFNLILDGSIAYEMCRPVSIYNMWYAKAIGGRVAQASMRCFPMLIVAFFLPEPYCLSAPSSVGALLLVILTIILGLLVSVAFCMFTYIFAFFTISPQGFRMILTGAVEFLAGSLIPLPFIPQPFRGVIEVLPFASMQNVPLRIYSGSLAGREMFIAILLQIIWLVVLIAAGKIVCRAAQKRVVVQGG